MILENDSSIRKRNNYLVVLFLIYPSSLFLFERVNGYFGFNEAKNSFSFLWAISSMSLILLNHWESSNLKPLVYFHENDPYNAFN